MIRFKNIVWFCLLILLPVTVVMGQQSVYRFSKPELLKTNDGKAIVIESGACAPFVRDMNGDGCADLLVGEFGSILCPGQEDVKGKRYVQGRCRIFYNTNSKAKFELLPYKWIESEGQPLFVPITCCMCMSPAFADINGDGYEDLLSGSYPGQLYWWQAFPDGSWGQRQTLVDVHGKEIVPGKAITIFAADMNGDGVMDILANDLYDGIFWIENIAGKNEQGRFRLLPDRIKTAAGTELKACYAILEDWDGDGRKDLLFGDNWKGHIYWCSNTGKGFAEPELLITGGDYKKTLLLGEKVKGPGRSPRFCVFDWNGDGKKDLVVGTQIPMQHRRHVSAEQLQRKAVLEKQRAKLSKTWNRFNDKAKKIEGMTYFNVSNVPYSQLPEKLGKKIKPVQNAYLELLGELGLYEEYYTHSVGHLWIYYQQ